MPNENRTPTATTSVARLIYHGLSDDREHYSGCGSEQYGWGYSLLKGVGVRRYIRYLERTTLLASKYAPYRKLKYCEKCRPPCLLRLLIGT